MNSYENNATANNGIKIGIINHQQSFLIYERFYGSDCITRRAELRDE
jgi:hypothetical protein